MTDSIRTTTFDQEVPSEHHTIQVHYQVTQHHLPEDQSADCQMSVSPVEGVERVCGEEARIEKTYEILHLTIDGVQKSITEALQFLQLPDDVREALEENEQSKVTFCVRCLVDQALQQ